MARVFGWLGRIGRPQQVARPEAQPDWHQTLLTLHNEARAARGAAPLTADWPLREAAQACVARFAAGRGAGAVAEQTVRAGYVFRTAGQNAAAGQPTPDAAFDAWMASTPHFRNVVNPDFVHFGAGRAADAAGLVYWCCVFAAPTVRGGPTAVAYVHAPAGLVAGAPGLE